MAILMKVSQSYVGRVGLRLRLVIGLALMIAAANMCSPAQSLPAPTMKVLHSFNGGPGDGYQPYAPVVVDPNGVLYGTTSFGGSLQCTGGSGLGCGEVFEVRPPLKPNGTWKYRAIYEFTGRKDGCCVFSALTLDSHGRVYGVNNSLFQLTPAAKPGALWKYADLFDFDFASGIYPSTPLLIDGAGALYGVSPAGGIAGCGGRGCGAVVQYVPSASGPWTQNILYEFTGGADGALPQALVMDGTGTLYGIAGLGGFVAANCTQGCGTVFKLVPGDAGTWAFSVVYSFTGTHDQMPYAMARDASGKVFGLASREQFATEVFQATPHKSGEWTERLRHRFVPQNLPVDYCDYAPSYVTTGANGVVYGAIFGDIDLYFGALFSLTPPAGGKGPWTYTTIWDFNESGPDLNPNGVTQGPDGALYGTTNGGDSSGGTVFRLELPSEAPWPPNDFCY